MFKFWLYFNGLSLTQISQWPLSAQIALKLKYEEEK